MSIHSPCWKARGGRAPGGGWFDPQVRTLLGRASQGSQSRSCERHGLGRAKRDMVVGTTVLSWSSLVPVIVVLLMGGVILRRDAVGVPASLPVVQGRRARETKSPSDETGQQASETMRAGRHG
jgi:hypothetical protein